MNTEQLITHLKMGRPLTASTVKKILSDLFELTLYRKLYKDLKPILAKADTLLLKEQALNKDKEKPNGADRTDGNGPRVQS